MESRRVVLLTEGYLRGWLKFDRKSPLSPLREQYLLNVLERQLVVGISKTKLDVLSVITSGSLTKGNLTALNTELQSYLELALPYMVEKTRIRNSQGEDTNNPDFWRKVLAQKRTAVTINHSEQA